MKLGLAIITLFAVSQVCLCFHEIPHMLVLGIAKRELMKNDMEIFNITSRYLTSQDSSLDTLPQASLEENAVWADDIKPYGNAFKAWEMWHFIGNKDENPEKLQNLKKDPMQDSENALNAYTNILNALGNEKFLGKVTELKILMLKMLTHIVGDIHMPHHTGSYYNSTIVDPKTKEFWGDLGGNRQKINFTTQAGVRQETNIHFFFDSSCYFYTWKERLARPVNQTFMVYFERELDRIMAQYPKSTLNIDNSLEFKDWADESWKIALTDIYPVLLKNNDFSYGDEFYTKSFNMIQKRIVLAGYRLANTLQKIFNAERGLITNKNNSNNNSNNNNGNNNGNNNNNNSGNNNNSNNQKDPIEKNITLSESSSDNDEANKAMAVVFGVLFGLTFIAFIAAIFYFKKNNTNTESSHKYLRATTDLIDDKKQVNTENKC